MTKKIIIIGSNSIHFARYISKFEKSKFDVIIITNSKLDGVIYNQYLFNFSLYSIISVFSIAKIIRQHKPDIMHIHQLNSYTWFSLLALRLCSKISPKVILTAWGSDILILPQKNIIFKKLIQISLKTANIVTSDSLFMTSQIKKLYNNTNVVTLNFGVNTLPEFNNKIKKQKIILSSRLHKSLYNVDKIIAGFAKLTSKYKEHKDYKLVIAASGVETENLKKLASQLGLADHVEFVGMLDYVSLYKYYETSQIYVSIPSSDATSIGLLEGLSYGCIPVLSNLPANLEWVIDEYNGLINHNINNLEDDLHAAITLANSDHYLDFYKINHAIVASKADSVINMQKFFDLYE